MSETILDPQVIVDFWREAGPEKWFEKDEAFDETIRQRFGDLYERAALGDLDSWADEPNGALALILLLDQFPRNMFRGSPRMYATDAKAAEIARASLDAGDAEHLPDDVKPVSGPSADAFGIQGRSRCLRSLDGPHRHRREPQVRAASPRNHRAVRAFSPSQRHTWAGNHCGRTQIHCGWWLHRVSGRPCERDRRRVEIDQTRKRPGSHSPCPKH